jgi:gliding motility-associated protein GldL
MTSEDGNTYADNLRSVSSKLSELSQIYDLQLQGSREQMESTKQFYSGISELMANLQASVEDTKSYKENISELSSNLSALNRVYGNMLAAMNVGGNS